ncbi:hypothetical protein HY620_03340 [Candidatus Uhrbacteria bacterium]|nr:hypothetical protein [Candidatus Uhrbacteria bacterium]
MSQPILMKTCAGTEKYYQKKRKSLTYEHSLLVVASFVLLFSTFLTVSTGLKAQEFAASVSASVPETPYNSLTTKNKMIFWWNKLDPYTQLMIQSGSGLVFVTCIALILQLQHRHIVRHKLTPIPSTAS